MLNPWIMFIVGLVLGWLLSWLLQRRLDDSLTGQVEQLQRELAECNRRLGETASAPAIEEGALVERAAPSVAVAAAAAVEEAEQLAPAPEAAYVPPEEEPAVEEPVTEELPAAPVVEEPVAEEFVAEPVAEPVEEAVEEAVMEAPAQEEVPAEMATEAPAFAQGVAADDLTVIKGISSKVRRDVAGRRHHDLCSLAQLTPEELEQIVQPVGKRSISQSGSRRRRSWRASDRCMGWAAYTPDDNYVRIRRAVSARSFTRHTSTRRQTARLNARFGCSLCIIDRTVFGRFAARTRPQPI